MIQDLVHNLCESLVENIDGVAGVGKKKPTPITYLTQWKIVGNSEVHGNEIWSCGEYNATDGKYHILVQPLGGSVADIALTEPLRKVGSVVDKIEYANELATVTRYLKSADMGDLTWNHRTEVKAGVFSTISLADRKYTPNIVSLCAIYTQADYVVDSAMKAKNIEDKTYTYYYASGLSGTSLYVYDSNYAASTATQFANAMQGVELIYELATLTTELVDAPQIAEAESFSMVISQGGKAVSWSNFITE